MCQQLTVYKISKEAEERRMSHVLRSFAFLAFKKWICAFIDQ